MYLILLISGRLPVRPFINAMKVNPAVAFTLLLLTMMLGAGIVSSSWGYAIGRQALTGVRQPETRPTNATTANREGQGSRPIFLNEDEIIEEVNARISNGD